MITVLVKLFHSKDVINEKHAMEETLRVDYVEDAMQPAKEKRAKRSICAKREARQRLTIQ
jgi:hypothetical protein